MLRHLPTPKVIVAECSKVLSSIVYKRLVEQKNIYKNKNYLLASLSITFTDSA